MTKYIKHYWKKVSDSTWITTDASVISKRHPKAEYTGLGVKVWMKDNGGSGIDVCLSEIPDSTTAADITEGSKKAVQVLTETQYNSVKTPYDAWQDLLGEADAIIDDASAKTAKENEATAKYAEAQTALDAL